MKAGEYKRRASVESGRGLINVRKHRKYNKGLLLKREKESSQLETTEKRGSSQY